MKKAVTISIDAEVNERWTNIAKKLELSKSGMVEEFIVQVLPILEEKTPNKMVVSAMREMAKTMEMTGSLFDDDKK